VTKGAEGNTKNPSRKGKCSGPSNIYAEKCQEKKKNTIEDGKKAERKQKTNSVVLLVRRIEHTLSSAQEEGKMKIREGFGENAGRKMGNMFSLKRNQD